MKIIAANWKMYKSPHQAREYFKKFKAPVPATTSSQIVFFPSSFALETISEIAKWHPIKFGPQNIYAKPEGAFTGENSAMVAKELGADYVLIGHSERRSLFKESNEQVAEKVTFVQSLNLIPLLCVGETLQEREAGQTNSVLEKQLKIALAQAEPKKKIVIAYEPIWAIGTGKVASVEQVAETHAALAKMITKLRFPALPILYGGSVKPDNAAGLSRQAHVSGFLVGGASLEPESFSQIVEAALKA